MFIASTDMDIVGSVLLPSLPPFPFSESRAHTRVSVAGAKVIASCCAGFMLHHTRTDTGCDDVTKVLLRLTRSHGTNVA